MNIVVPAVFGLVLLAGIVALAVGHKGWSWGTVTAAILALLASAGYVYLAARVAERERAWTKHVRKYEADVLRARDAAAADAAGGPRPIPGEKSLVALADEEDRWRRVLERVETWRGRTWAQVSFTPPRDDEPGTLALAEQEPPAARAATDGDAPDPAAAPEFDPSDPAAPPVADPSDPAAPPVDGGADPSPPPEADAAPDAATGSDGAAAPVAAGGPLLPINVGAEVSVFDDAPLAEGGRFLGLFRVVDATFDEGAKRTMLKVVPALPPDAADRRAWSKTYDAVTVYDGLPADRWMAFHRMPSQAAPDAAEGLLPDPAKADTKDLLDKLERLEAELERHGTQVEGEPAEIAAKLASGEAAPGRYWAVVKFTAARDLDDAVVKRIGALLAPDIDDEERVMKSFEPGDTAEFDLQTALDFGADVKILKVIDRRPLADASTTLLGGAMPGGAGGPLRADGLAALRRVLEAEIAALDLATQRLAAARENVAGQQARFEDERRDLRDDLEQWLADADAAERMAGGFENRLQRLAGVLTATVQAVGRLGDELTAGMIRLTAEIDREAPPPPRGGLAPAAATP